MCAIRCIAVCVYVDCVSCDLEAGGLVAKAALQPIFFRAIRHALSNEPVSRRFKRCRFDSVIRGVEST